MTSREDALDSLGRYGTVQQDHRYCCGPKWYGEVIEVHSSGDYLKFRGGAMKAGRWYHRRDVELHPLRTNQ